MNVTVRSAVYIADALGGRMIEVELNDGADIAELMAYLSETYGESFRNRIFHKDGSLKDGWFAVTLNGRNIFAYEGFGCSLKEGDDVLILPALSGGRYSG